MGFVEENKEFFVLVTLAVVVVILLMLLGFIGNGLTVTAKSGFGNAQWGTGSYFNSVRTGANPEGTSVNTDVYQTKPHGVKSGFGEPPVFWDSNQLISDMQGQGIVNEPDGEAPGAVVNTAAQSGFMPRFGNKDAFANGRLEGAMLGLNN